MAYMVAHEQTRSGTDFVPGSNRPLTTLIFLIPPVTWLSPQLLPSIRHGGFFELNPPPNRSQSTTTPTPGI